ncbi:complement receptor type 1-like isoform X3 [Onychostoma macrolepis]|uniref:complement receptor type 1-like isoform X3 n=1 Tax=Onychostoma macrolepis TaxID=369639 RepID=UPI00272D2A6D|nr:complement receptor type 1-like isoform X3 [Onychostoma macrolepis]
MGCKVLCPSVALLAYLIICQHVRAQCAPPPFASNVILTSEYLPTQSFPDGSKVTFECVIGHKPADSKASKSVTCQGNQWTSLELSCTRKLCGSLRDFLNGRYEMTGNLFGDTAKPVCDKGYMLAGQEATRTCRDQGWDGRDPLCESVKCTAPPAIENGQLDNEPLESYEYLQAVSYRCNGGLNLIGQSTLHCSEDGTFKPDPPKCFDGCPTPKIPNSKRTGGKSPPYKLGHFIEYKCDDGYTLPRKGYIVCRANGWDPEPPRCIENCRLPELSEHVTLTEEFRSRGSFTHGSNVIVGCISGYEPVDATVSKTITCEETKWTKSPLTCKALPTTPPTATTTTTAVTSTVRTTSKAPKEKALPTTPPTATTAATSKAPKEKKEDTTETSMPTWQKGILGVVGVVAAGGLLCLVYFKFIKKRLLDCSSKLQRW